METQDLAKISPVMRHFIKTMDNDKAPESKKTNKQQEVRQYKPHTFLSQ